MVSFNDPSCSSQGSQAASSCSDGTIPTSVGNLRPNGMCMLLIDQLLLLYHVRLGIAFLSLGQWEGPAPPHYTVSDLPAILRGNAGLFRLASRMAYLLHRRSR